MWATRMIPFWLKLLRVAQSWGGYDFFFFIILMNSGLLIKLIACKTKRMVVTRSCIEMLLFDYQFLAWIKLYLSSTISRKFSAWHIMQNCRLRAISMWHFNGSVSRGVLQDCLDVRSLLWCFLSYILSMLEYCSHVLGFCYSVSHLRLLDRVGFGYIFFAGGCSSVYSSTPPYQTFEFFRCWQRLLDENLLVVWGGGGISKCHKQTYGTCSIDVAKDELCLVSWV